MPQEESLGGKGRLKKLRKKAKNGEINTVDCYLECLASGIKGYPSLTFNPDPGRGQADFDLQSIEVRSLLMALLYNQQGKIPRVFSFKNRQFIRNIVVINFSGWGGVSASDKETVNNLKEAIPSDFKLALSQHMRISRNPLHIVPLMLKLMCCKGSDMDHFLSSAGGSHDNRNLTEAHNSKQALQKVGSKRIRDDDTKEYEKNFFKQFKDDNDTTQLPRHGMHLKGGPEVTEDMPGGNQYESEIPLALRLYRARLLLPAAMMRLWAYPLPVVELNKEREPSQYLHLPSVSEAGATFEGPSTCAREVGTVGEGVVPCRADAESAHLTTVPVEACTWSRLLHADALGGECDQTHGDEQTRTISRFSIPVLTRAGKISAGFCSTVPASSLAYAALFPPSATQGEPLPVCSVDCEMCMTKTGYTLSRLSVLTSTCECVLDVIVCPEEPITDYLTTYSGITADSLVVADITTSRNAEGILVATKRQAQLAFLRLVSSETIVVGHSVDSDLAALGVVHEEIVDTAYLYPHPKGFPWRSKLKTLAKDHLRMNIQHNSQAIPGRTPGASGKNENHVSSVIGHDPREDARAAMLLTIHRLRIEERKRKEMSINSGADEDDIIDKRDSFSPLTSILCGTGPYLEGASNHDLADSVPLPDVRSCICHDMSCDDTELNSVSLESAKFGGMGLSMEHGAYLSIGPHSQLHITATSQQAVARVTEFFGRSKGHFTFEGSIRPPPLSICAVNLRYNCQESSTAALNTILKSLHSLHGGLDGYLAIVTAQAPVLHLRKLQKQKLAVINSRGLGVVTWGHAQEKELLRAAKQANQAQICILTGAGSMHD